MEERGQRWYKSVYTTLWMGARLGRLPVTAMGLSLAAQRNPKIR